MTLLIGLVGIIITLGALLGAVKGIIEFYEWWQKKNEPGEETEE